eukprot:44361-Eustigmatos_ZCMA.PRE.1
MAAGATAVTCLIKRHENGQRRIIYAANVGDRPAPCRSWRLCHVAHGYSGDRSGDEGQIVIPYTILTILR